MAEVEFAPERILATLHSHGVRCVLMGGFAAVLYGSPFVTTDIDVVPASDAHHLGGMVVERQVHARVVGEVRGDVGRAQLDLPVLHVLGMHELDVPEDVHLPEEGGTDQPVEIAARHQAVTLCMKLGHEPCIGISRRK